MSADKISEYFIDNPKSKKIIIDVKSIFDKEMLDDKKFCYWNL
jgi:hypothetical protein